MYFQHWHSGAVNTRKQDIIIQTPGGEVQPELATSMMAVRDTLDEKQALKLLEIQQRRNCPAATERYKGAWTLHDAAGDRDAVQHLLLHSPQGLLQYVALHQGRLLVADPPVCSHRATFLQKDPGSGSGSGETEHQEPTGAPKSIELKNPEVKDCKEKFAKAARENCGRTIRATPLAAEVEIIDGMEIIALVKVTNASTHEHHVHKIKCALEIKGEKIHGEKQTTQGELLQNAPQNAYSWEVIMDIDICRSDAEDSANPSLPSLLDKYHMGEISLYKGYEHVARPNHVK